jgi:hypothetical protein
VVIMRMATPVATLDRSGEVANGGQFAVTRVDSGGSKQTRTADPFLVREVLYQLSYAPVKAICPSRVGFSPPLP